MNKKLSAFLMGLGLLSLITAAVFAFIIAITHPTPLAWTVTLGLVALLILIPPLYRRFASTRFVEWKDEYSVGIPSIDDQHKRLLGLINQLQTAVDYQTDDAFTNEALGELVDYTRTHFVYEEKLMQDNGYPDFEAHRKEHEAMVEQVGHFLERYKQDRDATIEEVTGFLKNWLINHINGTDKEYSSYLIGKGVR